MARGQTLPERPAVSVDASPLRASVERVEQRRAEATRYFYTHLFTGHPELRAIFPITAVEEHDRLFRALLYVMKNAHALPALAEELRQVGRDHRKFDLSGEHYRAVGASFLATAAAMLGESWTPEVSIAWHSAYSTAATVMSEAAAAARENEPRWWTAEVVSHERRTWDITVVSFQPAGRYPYRAGQYLTVETPHWPRLWRPYSIANAPRHDGRLEIHVKQISGGEGSWALVDATKAGQVVKLGPPSGGLVLDHSRPRDLLLVAGGTGLAPLKALVEDVAAHGGGRRVCLFVGARTKEELYDLQALTELDRRYPWLAVVPAVSEERHFDGHRGPVVEAVARYGPWTGFEAYVCGPPAMVAASVARLRELGIGPQVIHHEAWQADVALDAVPVIGSELMPRAGRAHAAETRRATGYRGAGMRTQEIYSDEVLEGTVYRPSAQHRGAADAAGTPAPSASPADQTVAAHSGQVSGRPAPAGPTIVAHPVSSSAGPQTVPGSASSAEDANAGADDARVQQIREMIQLRRARRSLYAGRRR
jgi:NAD(P)H-flavin reductase/hemoglobin-like flavoprotein